MASEVKDMHEVGDIGVTPANRVSGTKDLRQRERRAIAVHEIDDELLILIENTKYGEASE